jgi:hypothetical protein
MEAIIVLGIIVVALLVFAGISASFGVDSRDAIGDDHVWSPGGRR